MRRRLALLGFSFLLCWTPACERARRANEPHETGETQGADDARPATQQDRRSLTLLTYNVLGDPAAKDERFGRLLEIIREADADIVALQEVRQWSLDLLWREPWVRERYEGTTVRGKPFVARGLYLLSKLPVEKVTWKMLSGRQLRMALVTEVRCGDRRIRVGNVHLESPLESGAARAKQLEVVFGMLEDDSGEGDGAEDAVLLGDFNFGDGEQPETSSLDARYVDLWRALRPGEPGFTWNIEKSPMAREGSYAGEASRRLDRILVSSTVWRPEEVRVVGGEPVAEGGELFPSDHFGLVGVLVRE